MSGSPPVAAWPAGWRPSRGALALAVLVGLVGLQSASDTDGLKDPAWAVIALIEATALPLAVRSLWPLPVLGITLVAAVAGDLLFDGLQLAGPVIALYTVARHHDRRVSSAAAAVAAAGLAVPAASRAAENPLFAMAIYLILAAAWAIGDNVRRRHAYVTRVQAREAAIEEEQQQRARVAVAEERELPAGVDFSAYRIVQEALTNTLKHGHAATARVDLSFGEDMLDVQIVDDGTETAEADARTRRGHGLIGMRERASVFGGELEAGPRSQGGFAVRASIPLDGASR